MNIASGIQKFQESVFPEMRTHFEKLAEGQSPETLFITCSDSRIDPSLITQTAPGELFVIRNAGNIVPPHGAGELSVKASVQYAVDVLKVRRIVVCGHTHCGAVQGLLNLSSVDSMPSVHDWLLYSRSLMDRLPPQTELETAVEANVQLQLQHLMSHPCVSQAVDSSQLELQGWVYAFERGIVKCLENHEVSVQSTV